MKSPQELSEYCKIITKEFGKVTRLRVQKDNEKLNCNNTGGRTAYKGWPWIEYWRAMTQTTKTQLSCSSCGKVIFVGPIPKMMLTMFALTDDKPENHVAHGGHVWVNAPKTASYEGGRYITPLCPHCNGQHGKKMMIKADSLLCKEVGAKKDE